MVKRFRVHLSLRASDNAFASLEINLVLKISHPPKCPISCSRRKCVLQTMLALQNISVSNRCRAEPVDGGAAKELKATEVAVEAGSEVCLGCLGMSWGVLEGTLAALGCP